MESISFIQFAENKEEINQELIPSSKSLSNRMLILQFLLKDKLKLSNLSTSEDTLYLIEALNKIRTNIFNNSIDIEVGSGGTTFRFLLPLLCSLEGRHFIVKGSYQLSARPIIDLISPLEQMGANISINKNTIFPIEIHGVRLNPGKYFVDAQKSSQFLSSLLLIIPFLDGEFVLETNSNIKSRSYLDLTIQCLKMLGIEVINTENHFMLSVSGISSYNYTIESDFSSLGYLFCHYYLRRLSAPINFNNVNQNTKQGDLIILNLLEDLGLNTTYFSDRIQLNGIDSPFHFIKKEIDCSPCPDAIPTLVVLFCILNISFKIYGISTLKYKESNRAVNLKTELLKVGYSLLINDKEDFIEFNAILNEFDFLKPDLILNTYNDHRMAMSFSLLWTKFPNIKIENPKCVKKSFPAYWEVLSQMGIQTKVLV